MLRLSLVALLLSGAPAFAQDAYQKAHDDLKPRTLTLAQGEYTVRELLHQLDKQTGNRVVDQRRSARDEKITLAFERATFWQALEAVAAKAGCGFSPHHDEGVALVDAPLPKQAVSQHGIFRFALQRLQVVRDDALGSHWCHVTIEMMWEPRFDPILFDLARADAEFAADADGKRTRGKAGSGDRTAVRGRRAVDLEMRFPAPARSSPALAKLEGNVVLQGPSRMLTFDFGPLNAIAKNDPPRSLSQDGVSVSLTRVVPLSSLWTVHLAVKSPLPQGRPLESHQADLRWANMSVALHQTVAGKRIEWNPSRILPGEVPDSFVSPFRDAQDKRLADWALTCRVPSVFVELSAPFQFRDVPLP